MNDKQILSLLRKIRADGNLTKIAGVSTPKDGKSVDDVMSMMGRQLEKTASDEIISKTMKAIACLEEASEILENHSKTKLADSVISIIEKIATHTDRHTKGLTPAKQVKNLKDHGTQFNLSDDKSYLEMDVDDLKVEDSWANDEHDFED